MIDYIKISAKEFNYNYLVEHPILNFIRKVNLFTGEIEVNNYGTTEIIAAYKSLKFVIKESSEGDRVLLINGSLHKFYNDGEHNFDDFSFGKLYAAILHLCDIIQVCPQNLIIHGLEFAVNIMPPIKTGIVLKGLLFHHGLPFKNHINYKVDYHQIEHGNYIIKIYDKAKQYRQNYTIANDLLRMEIKQKRMNELIVLLTNFNLIDSHVLLLSDLLRIPVLEKLGERLLKIWDEIIIYDYTISEKKLCDYQIRKLSYWQNKNEWEDYSVRKRYYEKKAMYEVVKNHSEGIQQEIGIIAKNKINELLTIPFPDF